MMRIFSFALSLLFLTSSLAGAQTSDPSGAAFLRITPMARPLAMGNAYTGLAEGVDALSFNPAGLHTVDKWDVGLAQILYPFDLGYSHAAVARRLSPTTVGGLHLSYFGGQDDFRDAAGTVTGQFSNHDVGFGLTISHKLAPEIFIGATGRVIQSEIASQTATAVGADFGVKYLPLGWRGLTIGAAILNLGTGLEYNSVSVPQPLSARVGVAWQPPLDRYTVSADLSVDREAQPRVNLGGEYRVLDNFALRAGFDVASDASLTRSLKLGMGFQSTVGSFDYAFETLGFGNNHRFSYSYLGGRPRTAEVKDTGGFFGGFNRASTAPVRIRISPFVNLSPATEFDWLGEGFREIFNARFSREARITVVGPRDPARYTMEGRYSVIGRDSIWIGVKVIDSQNGMAVAFKEATILQEDLLSGSNTLAGAVAAAIPGR